LRELCFSCRIAENVNNRPFGDEVLELVWICRHQRVGFVVAQLSAYKHDSRIVAIVGSLRYDDNRKKAVYIPAQPTKH